MRFSIPILIYQYTLLWTFASCSQSEESKILLDFSFIEQDQFNYFYHNQDTLILNPENIGLPILFDTAVISTLRNQCPKMNCKNETDTEILGMYAIEAFTIEENMSKLALVEHGEAGLSKRYKNIIVASLKDQTYLSESDIKIGMSKDCFFNKLKLDKPEILETNSFLTVRIEDHWGIQSVHFNFNTSDNLEEIKINFRDSSL